MLRLPANVMSKGSGPRFTEGDILFSFGTDFTLKGEGRSSDRRTMILYIALPETNDNIDPG
jgi:hypothetical protein